jgi:hypothetical protein
MLTGLHPVKMSTVSYYVVRSGLTKEGVAVNAWREYMVNRVRSPDCAPQGSVISRTVLSPRLEKSVRLWLFAEGECDENDAGCRRDSI